jgi:hypothetical protein
MRGHPRFPRAAAANCAPPTVGSRVAEAFMSRTEAGSKRDRASELDDVRPTLLRR